ncbi:hypothetical protein VU10_02490, partial [Desulfobulbus sp. US1]|nr:hypothetical protein [Desulfobulbus sp. US1]
MKKFHYSWVLVMLSLFFPVFACAQSGDIPSDPKLHSVGDVLLTILVLSIVFEAAMTPIFNWRLFL